MKYIVGVADMKTSNNPGDIIVTHALGSCLGIAAHDPVAGVGGLLHVMLPMAKVNPEKAKACPCMFVDTGVPLFFHELYDLGAVKKRLIVKVAGGAKIQCGDTDSFAIGQRNHTMLKKMFWKNGILIESEDTGGTIARTMYLEIGPGRVWLSTAGVEKEL